MPRQRGRRFSQLQSEVGSDLGGEPVGMAPFDGAYTLEPTLRHRNWIFYHLVCAIE